MKDQKPHKLDKPKSVEVFVDELNSHYQFKVWGSALTSMFVLVKEGSEVLNQLNVGKTYKMKYYSHEESLPAEDLETEIKYVNKIDEGRFKGHYLTGLQIV